MKRQATVPITGTASWLLQKNTNKEFIRVMKSRGMIQGNHIGLAGP